MLHVIDRNNYKNTLCGMTAHVVLERQDDITAFPESIKLYVKDNCQDCFNHSESQLRILARTEL